MPISSKHLRANQRTVTEDYGDDGTLTITWRPGELNVDEEARVSEAIKDSRLLGGIVETLLKIIVSWDLLDEDGQPIELTRDALGQQPGAVIMEVWRIIREDKDGGPSGEGSSTSGDG